MKKLLIAAIYVICGIAIWSGEINGNIKVLEKGGEVDLQSFENAVVYIKNLKTPPPEDMLVLNQLNKEFIPRLIVGVKGQKMEVINNDSVSHNVFSKGLDFDLGYIRKNGTKVVSLDKIGEYKVYCNIHQNMITDVYVLENNYFAITDKNGNFVIKNAPTGDYILVVKHIYGGMKEINITVTEKAITVNTVITSTKYVRQIEDHLNKDDEKY